MSVQFRPHPLVYGGQLQTLVAYLWSAEPDLRADQELEVTLSDGDRLVLEINHPHSSDPKAPCVYLVHGLGGDARSPYKLRMAQKFVRKGWRAIRHNHRGAGAHAKLAQGIYHSGSALDILAGLQAIAQRFPDAPIYLIGFSLSGTMVLNLLGRYTQELSRLSQLKAALAVCAPIDLEQASRRIDAFYNKYLDQFYVHNLMRQVLARGLIDREELRRRMPRPSLRNFDEVVTAPLGGFQSRAHYYASCSPKDCVSAIRLPTRVLAAADDPIIPEQSVRYAPYSTHALLDLQPSGGHLGFICGDRTPEGDYRWLDSYILHWVTSMLPDQA